MIHGYGMRKITGALVACVTLLGIGAQATHGVQHADAKSPQPSPQKTDALAYSDDKSFGIWVPGPLKRRDDTKIPSLFGSVTYIMYQMAGETAAYTVGYVDYPADKYAHSSAEKVIAASSEGAHKKYGKGVLKDEKISYHGFPGKDLTCRTGDNGKIQIELRFFMVKNRMYSLSVAHMQTTDVKAETAHFMSSLKLLK